MDSFPVSHVSNAQPAGIGRVQTLSSGCAWNNLGRNVVFADEALRPRAVFGDTLFVDDAESSEFDLDIHAIVELPPSGQVAVLNHLGTLRIFEPAQAAPPRPITGPNLAEDRRLTFAGDVERVVGVGDRLVMSQPRGRRLSGVLLTAPVASARTRLDADTAHDSFGFVTALGAHSTAGGDGWVALGGDGRVRLVEADHGRLGKTRWDVPVGFMTAVPIDSGPTLWAAGSALGGAGLDDYDWEQLGGGGLAQLDLASGDVVSSGRFDGDLAWGSGGVPLALVDGLPCGVGRHGELHVLPPGERATCRLPGERAARSLGIAHIVVVGDHLLVGFNRGGYRLQATPRRAVTELVAELPLRRA